MRREFVCVRHSISKLEPITGRKSETAIPRNIDGSLIGKTIRRARYRKETSQLNKLLLGNLRTNRERVILPSSQSKIKKKNMVFIDQSAFSNFALYVINVRISRISFCPTRFLKKDKKCTVLNLMETKQLKLTVHGWQNEMRRNNKSNCDKIRVTLRVATIFVCLERCIPSKDSLRNFNCSAYFERR